MTLKLNMLMNNMKMAQVIVENWIKLLKQKKDLEFIQKTIINIKEIGKVIKSMDMVKKPLIVEIFIMVNI